MAVLRVPQDYETIQEATDAAKPGDSIVADATYSAQEYVNVETDNLTVGADKAAQQITLNLQGDATHLTLSGDAPITAYGSEQASVIRGNAGDNVIEARSSAADIIDGGDGNDVIVGDNPFFFGGGADQLSGGRGNDTFKLGGYVYEGAVIDGGDGIDTLDVGILNNKTINNVEILDGVSHSGAVSDFRQFKQFINSDVSSVGIGIFIDGQGGTLDFTSSVKGVFSVSVNAEAATSGVRITGSSNADSFEGSQYDDLLNGGGGNDVFTTSAGNDVLNGDAGDDVFVLDSINFGHGRIDGGSGEDTVECSTGLQDYRFSGVENLRTIGTSGTISQFNSFERIDFPGFFKQNIYLTLRDRGGTIDFQSKIGDGESITADARFLTSGAAITGSSAADTIFGSAYDDRLDGAKGADRLSGNQGNDVYIVDNRGDLVFEAVGEGTDTVVARVSYALQAGQEIEHLRSGDDFGTAAIDLTGNEFAQTIRGTFGDNVLDGRGGADALYGYGGNDTYVVDDAGDQVFESRGGGTDRVLASTSYTLQAAQEIETLQITDSKKGALNLTGNEFAQTLIGNNGANVLDGQGGDDTLIGRGGNDTYRVDGKADRVVEAVGGGHDTVIASGSYGLTAGQEIETLQLADALGKGRATLAGNAFDNTVIGNAGINTLDGGLGHDLLQGGEGRDTFVFSTALGPDNVDHIADFAHGIDTVRLAKSIFTALGAGALAEGAFKDLGEAGAKVDADDRIVYDHTTGDLSYDADGSGTAFTALRFAVVDDPSKVPLGHTDILIV